MSPAPAILRFVAVVCVAAAACTPTHSRMQPYRDDTVADANLAKRALGICSCRRGGVDLPPHAFTTDGCSMSPDGDWASCCVEHDIAYWCGGSTADRRDADRRLEACVVAKGHSRCFGNLVRAAVRGGGSPWEPFPWRWAYGWTGLRGYDVRRGPAGAAACFEAAH